MTCPSCRDNMIQTKATHFGDDYWYCRSCKKELAEMPPQPSKLRQMPPVPPHPAVGGLVYIPAPVGFSYAYGAMPCFTTYKYGQSDEVHVWDTMDQFLSNVGCKCGSVT